MKRMCEILKGLSRHIAVSGREVVPEPIRQRLTALGCHVVRTADGSVIAVKKCGAENAKKILLDAHMDEVGLIVTEIGENGMLSFGNHAGVDEKILPGARVTVLGKEPIPGIVAAKPPHLLTKEEREKPAKMKDMRIDIGLSPEKARETVRVGDFIALYGPPRELLGDRITGKSLDDRACVTVLISLLELLSDRPLAVDLYVVFSAGEEFGGYGAVTAALDVRPDAAIALDVSHAETPDSEKIVTGKLGKGVMIGFSPVLDADFTDRILACAIRNKIPYQSEAMGGKTYTNADNIVAAAGGIPTALLSVPLRYMHTPQEVVSLADMVTARSLLLAVLEEEGER